MSSQPYVPIDTSGTVAYRMDQQALATRASWVVNIILFLVKLVIAVASASKAVTASLIDSAVDLLSQAVLSSAEHNRRKLSADYPIGRSRLEALGVLACAAVMIFASVEVIQFSAMDLYNGLVLNDLPHIDATEVMFIVLFTCTVAKAILYLYCNYINKIANSDTIAALSEDHFNDVISNMMAIGTAWAAGYRSQYWWMDPMGAVAISAIIIYRWIDVVKDQGKKIVGYTAPPEFIESLKQIAEQHDPRIKVDVTRAYYFGSAYNCEMEIVLPAEMTVQESHDIALALQHKIEELEDIERAFVHVDYLERDGLEHKIERNLYLTHTTISSGNKLMSSNDQDDDAYNKNLPSFSSDCIETGAVVADEGGSLRFQEEHKKGTRRDSENAALYAYYQNA